MAKLVLPTLASGYMSVAQLNEAFREIEAFAELVLTRDGASPNQMEADFDLNGHTILNLDATGDAASILTYGQMTAYVDGKASGLIKQDFQRFVATASQTAFVLTNFAYTPNVGNLAVYKNGLRLFAGYEYTETNSTTITLLSPAALNDKIEVVSNEFLATASLPPHTHPWSQITNVPVYTTRWADWTEITGKPSTFAPSAHQHATTDISSGVSLQDQYRGVYVQSAQPTPSRVGDLWLW